jgi:hypothetical protein
MGEEMSYIYLHDKLKSAFGRIDDESICSDLSIKMEKRSFASAHAGLLPGAPSYFCKMHGVEFDEEQSVQNITVNHPAIAINDYNIISNISFPYYIMKNADSGDSKGVIFLFHGLNEKNWDKYLPWAYELVKKTGKAVIMFPIAFHMERAQSAWTDFRLMRKVAKERESKPGNSQSSFVNAAISERLQADPERIFWSGFQTYMDFSTLIRTIRSGFIEGISSDAEIDFFSYSIGSILSLILLMANAVSDINDSRLFIFCGGATLDRMYPISRYIMDMKACIAIQNFYEEQLNNDFAGKKRLGHYLSNLHSEQSYFKAMLTYRHFRELREERLKQIYERIYAVALVKDEIVPPHEVLNTLKGGFRDINTKVDVLDFEFPYNHATPFPLTEKYKDSVNEAFRLVMDKACAFLA